MGPAASRSARHIAGRLRRVIARGDVSKPRPQAGDHFLALTRARSLATIAELVDKGQTNLFDAKGDPLPTDAKLLSDIFGIVNIQPISAEGNSSRVAAGHWIQPSERGVAITDIVANLERVEAETLLLYGALDPNYIRFRVAAETALNTSRTAYVPGAGAFVIQDNPTATAAILNEFLEKG